MDAKETAALVAIALGLLEAVKLLIKALIDKKNGKPQPAYKHDFMERLGEMMDAQTKLLRGCAESLARIEPMIIAVDPSTNYPRVWADSPQQRRTHDNVSNIGELQGELAEVVAEIHKKVQANG